MTTSITTFHTYDTQGRCRSSTQRSCRQHSTACDDGRRTDDEIHAHDARASRQRRVPDHGLEAGRVPGPYSVHEGLNQRLREAGELVSAEGLSPPGQARIVRSQGEGAPEVTDGPFAESKEFLVGFGSSTSRFRAGKPPASAHVDQNAISPSFELNRRVGPASDRSAKCTHPSPARRSFAFAARLRPRVDSLRGEDRFDAASAARGAAHFSWYRKASSRCSRRASRLVC